MDRSLFAMEACGYQNFNNLGKCTFRKILNNIRQNVYLEFYSNGNCKHYLIMIIYIREICS